MKQKILNALLISCFFITACNNQKEKISDKKDGTETMIKVNSDEQWMKVVSIYLDRNMAFLNLYNFLHANAKLPAPLITDCETTIGKITNADAYPPEKNPSQADVDKFSALQTKVSLLSAQLLEFYQLHKELYLKENAAKLDSALDKSNELANSTKIEYNK
jgi:hypothetical protein